MKSDQIVQILPKKNAMPLKAATIAEASASTSMLPTVEQ